MLSGPACSWVTKNKMREPMYRVYEVPACGQQMRFKESLSQAQNEMHTGHRKAYPVVRIVLGNSHCLVDYHILQNRKSRLSIHDPPRNAPRHPKHTTSASVHDSGKGSKSRIQAAEAFGAIGGCMATYTVAVSVVQKFPEHLNFWSLASNRFLVTPRQGMSTFPRLSPGHLALSSVPCKHWQVRGTEMPMSTARD